MPWSDQGGDRRGGPDGPDLEEFLQRGKKRLKELLPGGTGWTRRGFIVVVAVAFTTSAFYSFTFRVNADERGVVLRFGRPVRQVPPGLHFRLPYPIAKVYLPKVERQNIVEVGFRSSASSDVRDIPGESLVLTGDENIIDVDFVVYWHIKDAQSYLFNLKDPNTAVKAVAESAMGEVIGQSSTRSIMTVGREGTEQAVEALVQRTLDDYQAGIRIDDVRLLKVDPPAQVIDAYRDLQAARADQERLENEALAYASRVLPEARGEAERIVQTAKGYKAQTVAEAKGQAARFVSIHEQYKKAPDVTRQRIYLETMERILRGSNKIIVGGRRISNVVPYLKLEWPDRRTEGSD